MAITETITARVQEQLPDASAQKVAGLVDRAASHFYERTNRRIIPDRAAWLLVDIAMAIYARDNGGGGIEAPVTSIKRGDTTIQYGAAADDPKDSLSALDQRINGYKVGRAK